nr:MAG TPA: hypothetical protein [Caudoviricetes sp.]
MLTNGGEYNPETAYEQLTMVMYENSTYITLKTVQGITPTDDHINYQLMAKGFNPTALASVQAEDTSGVLGEVGGTVSAQDLIDWVVDQAATKLLKISDLVSVQTNDATKGVSAALAYAMNQSIDQLDSNLNSLIKIAEVGVTDAIPINPSSKEVNTSISFQKSYTDPIVIATLCGGQGYVGAGCKVMSVKNNGATFKTYTTSPVGSDYSFYISYLVVVKNNQFKYKS